MRELLGSESKRIDVFIKELILKWRPYHNSMSDPNVQVLETKLENIAVTFQKSCLNQHLTLTL